jgi:hypothetical protein
MTDVIALSELSDEPRVDDGVTPHWKLHVSPRLDAVLDKLPRTNNTGTPTRIRAALRNAGIQTLRALECADEPYLRRKGCGDAFLRDLDAALAAFGLHRVGVTPPVVVRDGASAAEAYVQRLQAWIAERMHHCEHNVGDTRNLTERERDRAAVEAAVLSDVMLILDGREPTNKRRWS